jgi:hypothetical protein
MGLPVNAVPMQFINDAGFGRYVPRLWLHEFRGLISRGRIRSLLGSTRLRTPDRFGRLRRLGFWLFRNRLSGISRSQA